MIKRLKCRITGLVQMVMFRDFTMRKARSLGLVGTVQNTPGGSVYVIAEGEERKLKQLLIFLNKGPLLSRIDSVESFWEEATGEFSKFDIIYNKSK